MFLVAGLGVKNLELGTGTPGRFSQIWSSGSEAMSTVDRVSPPCTTNFCRRSGQGLCGSRLCAAGAGQV